MRPHDIGGRLDVGAVDAHDDGEAFHHEWEARVFAINRMLLQAGVYTLDEFRFTIESMEPEHYSGSSYYERWLFAVEALLARKGVALDGV